MNVSVSGFKIEFCPTCKEHRFGEKIGVRFLTNELD